MAKLAGEFHVVMLPWSAFGHMIPFYELSVALAKKGVRVSYVSTPRNIERLPTIPRDLATLMQYVSLPLPEDEVPGLPKGAEATVDLEFDEIPFLKAAYDLLYKPLKQFVSDECPDWVISDFAAHWLPDIAEEVLEHSHHQVNLMFFSVFTASTLLFACQMSESADPESPTTLGSDQILPPSVAFRAYEASKVQAGYYGKNASGMSDAERFTRLIEGCQAVGVRSCSEFEGARIDSYQKLIQLPVIPVGLLPPAVSNKEAKEEALDWLDRQSTRSVIYVGFGSEYKLTKEQVYEIAYGLELAGLPFIWALRRPTWAATDDDSEALPSGFLSRVSGKGFVCLGWAPQLQILAHPSVGGSLFHSGWGSIIETLQHGHSLILLPFILDQGLNARVMVDKGLGIEVDRREDGSYTRDDIANALIRAKLGDEAEKIRARAAEAATIFADRNLQEEHYITEFVEYLRN